MSEPDERLRDALEAELRGERGDRDPALEERLARLLRIAERLEAAGAERREVLATARGLRVPAAEERLAAGLRARQAAHRSARRWPWILVAAAAAALVFLLPKRADDAPATRTEDRYALGSDARKAEMHPNGDEPDWPRFTWMDGLDEASAYRVQVYDADGNRIGGSNGRVVGSIWMPEPEDLATWPNVIDWELTSLDVANNVLAIYWAHTSRSH